MMYAGLSFPNKIAIVVICVGLAACGSSDSSVRLVRDQPVLVRDQLIVDIAATSAEPFISRIADSDVLNFTEMQILDDAIEPIADTLFLIDPVTPWAAVPTTGNTEIYVGGIELVPGGNSSNRLFGTISATTNIANASIAGEAQNFYSSVGGEHRGMLLLSADFFRGNDLTQEFGISGSLDGDLEGSIIDGPVTIGIGADFADDATIIYGGGTGTAANQSVEASFVLSQN